MSDSIQRMILGQVDADPDRRAIAFMTPGSEPVWRTRAEFYAQASGIALQLRDRGLDPGARCVLVLRNDELSASILMGVLVSGAIPLLVAPPAIQDSPNSNLAAVLKYAAGKTSASHLISGEPIDGLAFGEDHQPVVIKAHEELTLDAKGAVTQVLPGALDTCALQLTSGTTGFPKVCVWRQQGVVAAVQGMESAMGLGADDICVNWTPLYHDMGLVNNFFLCMTKGVALALLSPHDFVQDPGVWLRTLSQVGASTTWSPNFGYALATKRADDATLDGCDLTHVRAFWNAAERIHHDTMVEFYDRFRSYGVRRKALKTNFGCAENVGGATFSTLRETAPYEHLDRERLEGEGVAVVVDSSAEKRSTVIVSAGAPAPGVHIEIWSENDDVLPDGEVGEIILFTESRMEGYLGPDGYPADGLSPGAGRPEDLPLMTGDLGYLRDGELFWVGRLRERITVRGKKFDPSDFEPVLLKVAGLREGCFVVFGVDDEATGTQNVVVVAETRKADERQRIAREIREEVFKVLGLDIRDVVLTGPGELSKTSSGKRRHSHFRRLYREGKLGTSTDENTRGPTDAPSDEQERKVLVAWEDAFGVSPIGPDDNFFDLGGNSLLAVQLFARLERDFDQRISMAMLFKAPTARELARSLTEGVKTRSLVEIQPHGSRRPLFLMHGAGGNVLFYRELADRLGHDQPVFGLQPRWFAGEARPKTITVEEMASHYVSEIRSVQAHGPYLLGGSSFGGVAAFEMAQQLQDAGEEVALVALFDSYTPEYARRVEAQSAFSKLWRRVQVNTGKLLHAPSGQRLLQARRFTSRARKRLRRRIRRWRTGSQRQARVTENNLPPELRKKQDLIRSAQWAYTPKVYDGPLTLFRAAMQPLGSKADEYLGWGCLSTGKIVVHPIEGYHGALVLEPFLPRLMQKLQPVLDEAQALADAREAASAAATRRGLSASSLS